jgi:hypothetical protein
MSFLSKVSARYYEVKAHENYCFPFVEKTKALVPPQVDLADLSDAYDSLAGYMESDDREKTKKNWLSSLSNAKVIKITLENFNEFKFYGHGQSFTKDPQEHGNSDLSTMGAAIALKIQGNYYIADGQHRAAEAMLRNQGFDLYVIPADWATYYPESRRRWNLKVDTNDRHTMSKLKEKIQAAYVISETAKLDPSAFKPSQFSPDDGEDGIDIPDHPPKILYHVTNKKNLASIKKKGLVPKVGTVTRAGHGDKNSPATPMVYLSDTVAPGILGTHKTDAIIIAVDPKENNISLFTGYELVEIDSGGGWGSETTGEGDFPIGIETGDFFSEGTVTPLAFYDYKGNPI